MFESVSAPVSRRQELNRRVRSSIRSVPTTVWIRMLWVRAAGVLDKALLTATAVGSKTEILRPERPATSDSTIGLYMKLMSWPYLYPPLACQITTDGIGLRRAPLSCWCHRCVFRLHVFLSISLGLFHDSQIDARFGPSFFLFQA